MTSTLKLFRKNFHTRKKFSYLTILSLFMAVFNVSAQNNTSYDLNGVPIGGSMNVGIGFRSLISNTTGTSNTGVGANTLNFNTSGEDNVAAGANALLGNTTGRGNTAVGNYALRSNSSGNNNTAIGYSSMSLRVIAGSGNTTLGTAAFALAAGENNTVSGYEALRGQYDSNCDGNAAYGMRSLYSLRNGYSNVAMGIASLHHVEDASNLVAIGDSSLYNNVAGENTAVGSKSLFNNTTATKNTAVGFRAAYLNFFGEKNTTIGFLSLFNNIAGNGNTVAGAFSLFSNQSGSNNIAFGDSAGFSSNGHRNIFIGHSAGFTETGNDKFYAGNGATKTLIYGDMSTGQVLLGVPDATGYNFKGNRTLNVAGGIIADSVRVALSGAWSDFVFSKEYQLMPLSSVKHFTSEHHRLPGMPGETEVAKNGIDVGAMDAKLLEKIEESYLYIFELQQQLDQMKKQNIEMQEQINALEKRMLLKNK